eukprot:346853-Pleurochrysis_carterae.AAC.1
MTKSVTTQATTTTPQAEVMRSASTKSGRRYSGPAKGSNEAKEKMARVRAAQWAKNGLSVTRQNAFGG